MIVLIDDEQSILELQKEALFDIGLSAEVFSNPVTAWERIQQGDVALVVTDFSMPQMTGMDLLFKTRALQRPPYVIIITANGTITRAVQAMNEGAFNFIEKPFDISAYQKHIKLALEQHQRAANLGVEARKSKRQPIPETNAPVVHSAAMRKVLDAALSASATDSSVLLLGESGTGKEVMADYIHSHSLRHNGPLVKVNCGALPEHLMESELFGHEKGAFTGAEKRNIGRFEHADGGTLFLDEIGDLLLPLQVKLLRVLQGRTIERLGASTPIPVDFRLICATHCDLNAAIADRKFREDLFYRINVVPIRIPALRERPDDIEPLANRFFKALRGKLPAGPDALSAEAMEVLRNFSWPGNVRQLRNAIEYALVLCKQSTVGPDDLPDDVRRKIAPPSEILNALDSAPATPVVSAGLKGSIQEAEAEAILAALNRHHWRMTTVARDLKISRSTLYARIDLYGIKRPE